MELNSLQSMTSPPLHFRSAGPYGVSGWGMQSPRDEEARGPSEHTVSSPFQPLCLPRLLALSLRLWLDGAPPLQPQGAYV